MRIDPDLRRQTVIPLPEPLLSTNIHSTQHITLDGEPRLVLTANEAGLVAVVTLDGRVVFTLGRPALAPYDDPATDYQPTDTVLVGETLYVADGYGANVISRVDLRTQEWLGAFGSKNTEAAVDGQFGTAHGITTTADGAHLLIADRWHSRLQIHRFDGAFVGSHALPKGDDYVLPKGMWPCGFHTLTWRGRAITVIANLYAPGHQRPAPVLIVDALTFEILATVRPKEELGVGAAQRLHNVVGHVVDDRLFLVGQSWNPGSYFVLASVD